VASTIFASRFCRFEVPPGWTVLPGAGAVESRPGTRLSAVVTENWLEQIESCEAFARRQKELLQVLRAGTVAVEEKPLRHEVLQDVRGILLRAPGPAGTFLRQEQILAIEGHLAACLTLTGPEADAKRREQPFETVRRTFEIPGRAALRKLTRAPLLVSVSRSPPPVTRVTVPPLQISLPVPDRWRFDQSAAVLRGPGEAEISFQRTGLPASSVEELFAEALSRALRDPAFSPARWDRGRTAQGQEAFALESVGEGKGTWVRTEAPAVREVFTLDESALVFRLRASERDEEARSALAAVVDGYALLPQGERRLRVPIAWMPVELSGPWQQGAPGVFVRTARPALALAALKIPAIQGLEKFADEAAKSLRPSAEGVRVSAEERRRITWKGVPLYRYTVDAVDADEKKQSIRAAWFGGGDAACAVIVQGEGRETDSLFEECLNGLRPLEAAPK
jgi:hypothetical protein